MYLLIVFTICRAGNKQIESVIKMKKIGIFILIIILLGTIMYFTNPTKDNFNAFLERKASRNITKYVGGSQNAIDELINNGEPINAKDADIHYDRYDYYVVSVYKSDSIKFTTKYLGVFKLFLILD